MPLVRLDRHGLTVAVVDDAGLPVIGLPRRALVACDSTPLCELRLVARAATSEEGRAAIVTLQPSRADDHAQLWQALRASQTHRVALPARGESAQPSEGAPSAASRQTHAVSERVNVRALAHKHEPEALLPAASAADPRGSVSCDAAFSLASPEDAWFFARWLDYHFAELRARSRMCGAAADLHDLLMRVVDHEVEVRLVFQSTEAVVHTTTELACRWITAEAARQLDMTVEDGLYGKATACGSPAGWPAWGVMASRTRNASFSPRRS